MWVIKETVGHTNLDIYVLLLSFGRYLCRWTHLVDISTGGHIWSISLPVDNQSRGYHPPSSQCFGTDMH